MLAPFLRQVAFALYALSAVWMLVGLMLLDQFAPEYSIWDWVVLLGSLGLIAVGGVLHLVHISQRFNIEK